MSARFQGCSEAVAPPVRDLTSHEAVLPDPAHSAALLFGPRWKTPFAHYLGVSRETVSRWSGDMPLYARRVLALMIHSRGAILSLCDHSGIMVRPWVEAGFDCLCVDLRHEGIRREGTITYMGADLLDWLPPPRRYAMVFAFPPCTHVAVSGARWFQDKGLGGLSEAVDVLEACRRICDWSGAPWMIENPVSTFSGYWRKPDYSFHPCEYGGYLTPPGDAYTKKTCLWTGGGFQMPAPRPVEPTEGSKMHRLPPSADRAHQRSLTPRGFARAVFDANATALFREHSQANASGSHA